MTDKTKFTDRIAALLAKAESTEYAPEADALYQKAQSLMAQYAITQADLAASGDAGAEEPISEFFMFSNDDRFRPGKLSLLQAISKNNRVEMVFVGGNQHGGPRTQTSALIGMPSDVYFVKMLYTSLLMFGLNEAGKAFNGLSTKHRWTSSFLLTYAQHINKILRERRIVDESAPEASNLPAVYDAVAAKLKDEFPNTKSSSVSVRGAYGADAAGKSAAGRADLSGGRNKVGGARKAISA